MVFACVIECGYTYVRWMCMIHGKGLWASRYYVAYALRFTLFLRVWKMECVLLNLTFDACIHTPRHTADTIQQS
jgi:hypothetical protein